MSNPWQNSPFPAPRRWAAEALPALASSWRRGEKPLGNICPGAGKTELTACLADNFKGDVLFLAPTQALVRQTGEHFKRWGIKPGYWFADLKDVRRVTCVCFNSIESVPVRNPELMIIDECHGIGSKRRLAAIEKINPKYIVGLTGSAFPSDPKKRLPLFDAVPVEYRMHQGIADGVLVPWLDSWITPTGEPLDADLCGHGATQAEMQSAHMIRRVQGIGIACAPNSERCDFFASYLCKVGISARSVHSKTGTTPKDIVDLAAAKYKVAVQVDQLTTGIDIPHLTFIVFSTPMGAVRVVQLLGRGMRASPGKDRLYVLDAINFFESHGINTDPRIGSAELEQLAADEIEMPSEIWVPVMDGDKRTKVLEIIVMTAAQKWVRTLALKVQMVSGKSGDKEDDDLAWRVKLATPKQINALAQLGKWRRHIGEPHKAAIAWLLKKPHLLRRGAANDLIFVLYQCSQMGKPYRDRWQKWFMPLGEAPGFRAVLDGGLDDKH